MRSRFPGLLALLTAALCLAACYSTKPYYHPKERTWQTRQLPLPQQPVHTLYLIGDAGKPDSLPLEPGLKLLRQQLRETGKNGTVIFLGDNIYPAGMLPEDHKDRAIAEQHLNTQLDAVKDYEGKVFFIPGNHDWNKYSAGGRAAILRQQAYIEAYLGRKGVLQPPNACGDPTVVKLADDVVLIMLDSEWYLHKWKGEPGINEGCEIKSRHEFEEKIQELIDEYDDQRIIIALHHPLRSVGEHGGYFSIKEHLFPLTHLDEHLYIPTPLLGSLVPALRYLGISAQEIPHPKNKKLVNTLLDATFKRGNIVFVSGHEHTLQYFEDESILSDRHFIISGSGSKSNYVRRTPKAEFATSAKGFARLLFYADGATWLEVYRPLGDGSEGELIYRRQIKSPDLSLAPLEDPVPLTIDSVVDRAGDIYEAGKGKQKFFGKLYRDVWSTELKFPVLDLSTHLGGLTPVKKGGGFQTQSLRLQNPEGKQYVLRSVAKDVSKAVAGFFPIAPENSVIREIIQDQIAMSHPYSAMVVPPLADAARVFHTNPTYYYVPKQAMLGDFSEDLGDQLFLFEERPAKDRRDVASFGRPKDIESTPRVLRALHASNKTEVDQQAVLRARLLDMWLGDWDRHDDQWRWAEFKQEDGKRYVPIPRDRDQVFSVVNGFIPWLLTRKWGLRYLHDFDYDTRDIQGLNYNARYFDRSFLTAKDRNAWMATADTLRAAFTDSLIEAAIGLWPKAIYELHGPEIIAKLKARRDRLPELASRYYHFLAKEVEVMGSDQNERFEVARFGGNQTRVRVYRLKKSGEKGRLIYERVFHYPETREVRLYGLNGEDEFYVSGTAATGSLLRIIGGGGKDRIIDESRVGGGKRTLVYDVKGQNELQLGREAKDKTQLSEAVNAHDRKAFKLNHLLPLVLPGFNVDDGFSLAGGFIATQHGWRKEPYKSKHSFLASLAFSTRALDVKYQGDFTGALGKLDFYLDARAHAPTYVVNYFGLGNETRYTEMNDDNFDFNRVRMSGITVFPALKKSFNEQQHLLRLGPVYAFTRVSAEENEGRFVVQDNSLGAEAFEPKHYAGLQFNYHIDAVDNPVFPMRGLRFNFQTGWYTNLRQRNMQYTSLQTDLAVFFSLYAPTLITLGSRVGYARNWGEYEFFQAQTLGRRSNLRAYRGERFAGDAAFFHNTDLRIRLFKLNNYYLPLQTGLIAFFDYGRVWLAGEQSTRWHRGYGGGIVISPYSAAVISATYSLSKELNILEVKMGFFF